MLPKDGQKILTCSIKRILVYGGITISGSVLNLNPWFHLSLYAQQGSPATGRATAQQKSLPQTPRQTGEENPKTKIPIFSGGKSNVKPTEASSSEAGKASTPEAVVQSLLPKSSPPVLSERQTAMLKQSATERQAIFRAASDEAAESLRLCKDSFDRGLMPLLDFAEQASSALEIRLVIADLKEDRSERIRALTAHYDLMKAAAKQLAAFNQPASEGWAADTAFVNLLAANAELRLAAARGDQGTYARAAELGTKLADEQYLLRLTDFRNGQASLSQLAIATKYQTALAGLPSGLRRDPAPVLKAEDDYLTTLENVVEQTQKFAQQGAGIGREDLLFQAEYELAKANGQAALKDGKLSAAAEAFNRAVDSAEAWYASEMKFHETGTASLRDMTHAWWSRAELTDLSERSGLIGSGETQKQLDADFNLLKRVAENTQDRRGRIEADISYTKSLGSLESLWARQRAVLAMAAYKAAANKAGATTAGGADTRVIDLTKRQNPQATPDSNTRPMTTSPTGTIPGTTPIQRDKSKNSPIEIVSPKRAPK